MSRERKSQAPKTCYTVTHITTGVQVFLRETSYKRAEEVGARWLGCKPAQCWAEEDEEPEDPDVQADRRNDRVSNNRRLALECNARKRTVREQGEPA